MWPGLIFSLSLRRTCVFSCLPSPAHKSFHESREPLALAADLWADRTGLGVHFRRMRESHSALRVHVFSNVWTRLIRQKELAKDQGEWNLSLFAQQVSFTPSFITRFYFPFLTSVPLLLAVLCSQALLLITLFPCSIPVFLCFTLDFSWLIVWS